MYVVSTQLIYLHLLKNVVSNRPDEFRRTYFFFLRAVFEMAFSVLVDTSNAEISG